MHTKICNECKIEFPATTEYFHKSKDNKYGLRNTCKKCRREKRQKGYNKEYYQENKKKILEYQKKYRKENKDKIKKYFRELEKTEKRKKIYITKGHRKKALANGLKASFTADQWKECKHYFNNKCAYCGKSKSLQQDHFIPFSKGGEYTKNNILPACSFCNNSKHKRNFFDWYPKQTFYSKERKIKILNYLALN